MFERFGYGQVAHADDRVRRGSRARRRARRAGRLPVLRRDGALLAMRTDMTIPIARLVATRFADAEPPFRLSYIGNAYRAVRPQRGQMRSSPRQGSSCSASTAPEGTAEVIEVLSARSTRSGSPGCDRARRRRSLPAAPRRARGARRARDRILELLAAHDLVGLEDEVDELEGLDARRRARRCCASRTCGAGPRCSSRPASSAAPPSSGRPSGCSDDLRRCWPRGASPTGSSSTSACSATSATTRGAILEVYDPALGHVLGGGGRYDELMGRFGRPLPAAGFALYLERVHVAQAEEERRAAGGRR